MTEMIKVVFPKRGLSSAVGTKFFLGDKELDGVISFSVDPTDSDSMCTISLKFALGEVEYCEDKPINPE